MTANFDQAQLTALKAAIARNPARVKSEAGKFLAKAIRAYNEIIIRAPWRVGGSGGGSPVDTGNLRDTHRREISQWQARIYPTASYSKFVHEGTAGMKARPWLDYAVTQQQARIDKLADDAMTEITKDLAK